jgi:2'-5' RNA ligase
MPTEKERHERLFVGVPLTTGARDELAKRLPKSIPGKAVSPKNWHVTLRFLGQTPREQRDLFVASLQNTTFPTAFRIAFTSLGAFPSPRRAKVLWIGIDKGAPALVELAELVNQAAISAGFPAEPRRFHAHLTIARIDPPMNVRRVLTAGWRKPVLMQVSTVVLFRSRLGRGPAQYEAIEQFWLGKTRRTSLQA